MSTLGNIGCHCIHPLLQVFKHTLQHQAGDVRVAALKAATTFIRDLESSSDRNKLQDLVGLSMGPAVTSCMQQHGVICRASSLQSEMSCEVSSA